MNNLVSNSTVIFIQNQVFREPNPEQIFLFNNEDFNSFFVNAVQMIPL